MQISLFLVVTAPLFVLPGAFVTSGHRCDRSLLSGGRGWGGLGTAGAALGLGDIKGLLQLKQLICDPGIGAALGVKPQICTLQEESGFTWSKRDFFLSAEVSSWSVQLFQMCGMSDLAKSS